MEALRAKLKSRDGASILLALLFMLVCMMVAASILMAAVSNAGRVRSGREEHQKYLVLSSALQLVCGELDGAAYCGKYNYERREEDEDGDGIGDYHIHTYTQQKGSFTFNGGLEEKILPLVNDLDRIFADQFVLDADEQMPGDLYYYTKREDSAMQPRGPFTLTLTADVDPSILPDRVGAAKEVTITEEVTITVELEKPSGILHVTAALGSKDASGYIYTMEAELEPDNRPENILKLGTVAGIDTETVKITWRLVSVTKGAGV